MEIKEFLQAINIRTADELLACGELLWQASTFAGRLQAAKTLDEVCQSWDDLPDDLKINLWESAGEDNDDRNKITITVFTKEAPLALRAIQVFAGSQVELEDIESIAVWGDPAFVWGPHGETFSSHFRKVMDAVAEMYGPFSYSRTTVKEIRNWVAGVLSVTENLFHVE